MCMKSGHSLVLQTSGNLSWHTQWDVVHWQSWLGKHCKWEWTELKDDLTLSSVLASPDMSKHFEVVVAACGDRIGAVLLQDDGPIAFESRKFTDTEKKYIPPQNKDWWHQSTPWQYGDVFWKVYQVTLVTDHHPNTCLPSLNQIRTGDRQGCQNFCRCSISDGLAAQGNWMWQIHCPDDPLLCCHQLQSTSRLEATCRSFTAKSRISQNWLPVDYKINPQIYCSGLWTCSSSQTSGLQPSWHRIFVTFTCDWPSCLAPSFQHYQRIYYWL